MKSIWVIIHETKWYRSISNYIGDDERIRVKYFRSAKRIVYFIWSIDGSQICGIDLNFNCFEI